MGPLTLGLLLLWLAICLLVDPVGSVRTGENMHSLWIHLYPQIAWPAVCLFGGSGAILVLWEYERRALNDEQACLKKGPVEH